MMKFEVSMIYLACVPVHCTHVETYKLLQVCKQVVTNLFTSCQQVVFALLVPSCCNKFGTLLTTCNKLEGIIRLDTRLF
jgi:surface polysaccharide O-acyltransferase-like enzyme